MEQDTLPMTEVPHELILASAGSGKTYQLTNRFLRLVGLGVDPERILALTFTRKAAGEFFVAILEKLVEGATDPERARALAHELDLPEWGPEDFLAALREVTRRMGSLTLGTLDSFFARVVGEFAFELGAPPQFQILDEATAAQWSRRAMGQLFGDERRDPEARRAFLESFKQASFGKEGSTVSQLLDGILLNAHEVYLAYPQEALWGSPQAIWGTESNPWWDRSTDWRRECAALEAAVHADEALQDKQRARLLRVVEALRDFGPGSKMKTDLKYLFDKVSGYVGSLKEPAPEIVLERRKWSPSEALWRPLLRLVRWMIFQEIQTHLNQAQGIWRTLSRYEAIYDAQARRRGAMRFSDLPRILGGAWGAERGPWRLDEGTPDAWNVAYRLDARLDHWLLDEFQDTSRSQWAAMEPLVDEVAQDPEGRRSLFVVGDIKQSIYRWRGGEPKLFETLRRRYNSGESARLRERPLNDSWRSAPPVIDAVNRVFGEEASEAPLGPLGQALRSWPRATHVSRRADLPGYVSLMATAEGADSEVARWELVVRVLRAVDPLGRCLSVAILARRNSVVYELADYIRTHAPEIPVATDTEMTPLVDNPIGVTLLALLKASAHPGDGLAWGTVLMSPLGPWMRAQEWSKGRLARAVIASLSERGWEETLERWIAVLESESGPWDRFSAGRARHFVEAGAAFDRQGDRSVDAFLRFAPTYRRQRLQI